ncbi:MAG: LytTR family DNA-binding domain-containing protein [Pseudomonadota bacterium]
MPDTVRELSVLIVDDEAPARVRLREVLADCRAAIPNAVAGEAATGPEALELLGRLRVDVMLLDIRMPGMDGLEVARHAQKLPAPPAIVFTTAYDSHAMQAFEVSAIDYLLKPVRAERLALALQKARALAPARLQALQQIGRQPRTHLSVAERGRVILVPVGDILYLRAELKYVTVQTPSRQYLVEESLSRLEEEFGERFLRIHRNCLVARACIEGFERTSQAAEGEEGGGSNWVVMLRGLAEKLPVSRRQAHVVREFRRS